MFEVAFEDLGLRTDLRLGHLYNGACSAALAERPRIALAWLAEDLQHRRQELTEVEARLQDGLTPESEKALHAQRDAINAHLDHARVNDPDLASLRSLPEFVALFE